MPTEPTTECRPGRGRDGAIALALGAGFLSLYLRTLCPTVYLGDSGEISTAIATGGIIHPPGYPLFSLLGRAALVLVPCGEPAFRIGCLVALAAAAAVAALYTLAREIGASPWAAALGAAAFGASHTFWSQSTRVEVYSLHALFACLLLWTAVRYRRTGVLRDLAATALAGSLGLAHHLTIVLLAPGLLALCARRLWSDPGRGRRLLTLATLLPTGPALYLLLLVWARAAPLQNWGRPVTLPLLWNHASARFYRGSLCLPDGPHRWHRLAQSGALYTNDFPLLACLLPLMGAGLLWKKDRGLAAGLLLVALAVVSFNFCYRIEDIAAYYLSAWIAAAALMAPALDRLQGWALAPARRAALAPVLCLWLVALPVARNWRACDLSRATWVREFARQKLENTDPGGVLISASDDDIFPLWYVHDLLGVRPDVFPIDRVITANVWWNYGRDPSLWYLYRLRRQGASIRLNLRQCLLRREELAYDGWLIDLLNGPLRGRPICMTFLASPTPGDPQVLMRWARQRYQPVPLGLLTRLQPRGRPVDLRALIRENERLWARMPLPDLRGISTADEIDPGYIAGSYACSLVNFGGLYELAGDRVRAEALYRRVAEWAPGYQPARAALAALGQPPLAG